jgi:hypothetical protein
MERWRGGEMTDPVIDHEKEVLRALQTARDILLRHPPCLTDAPMNYLIEDIATAIVRAGQR